MPSKINVHLAVGEARDDGYHEVTTLLQALSLTDDVTVATGGEAGVEVHGEGARSVPTGQPNLAWQAAQALGRHTSREDDLTTVRIVLRKNIPVGGGMAGGSADAAAVLVALNALWKLDLSRDELAGIAADLGSDVPFCLHGGTALGTGRGEQLVPVLSRHEFHWVLALDQRGLAVSNVYAELDRLRTGGDPPRVGSSTPVVEAMASGDPHRLASMLGNDLQAAVISLRPHLRRTLRAGVNAGALAGTVSGSGPTCAFLCESADSALKVAAELAGAGVCRTVRVAHGPAPGARMIEESEAGEGPVS